MISSSCWVPRGYAAEFPEKYELDDEELARITQMANLELSDAKQGLREAESNEGEDTKLRDQIEIDDDLKEYNLEDYDNEGDDEGASVSMFPGLSGSEAKFHQENSDDPYLSLPTEVDAQEEKKELQIYPTDNLILATRTEDDVSYLDVYVYDDGAGALNNADNEIEDDIDAAKGLVRESNLYTHHDIMLPSFPLTVEWINFRPGLDPSKVESDIGNFAAIGTFDPQIEVWNLDSIDKAFPDMILGEPHNNSFGSLAKKKKKSKSKHVTTHHVDAVLSLSHNKLQRSILASTSADKTVKLWDLMNGTAVRSLDSIHQRNVVSSSQWHSMEESFLLTGGYDGTAALSDVRASGDMTKYYKVSSGEEVENVRWDITPEVFYAGTDNGNVYCFDVRNESNPLWTLHAHDSGISGLDVNAHLSGLLVTSSMNDKVIKLWKCPVSNQGGPSMVLSRDFGVGNVLTASFATDVEVAGNVVVGGATGALKMWDVFSNGSVRKSFQEPLRSLQESARANAKSQGRVSRLARKYLSDETPEVLLNTEEGDMENDSDDSEDVHGSDKDEYEEV